MKDGLYKSNNNESILKSFGPFTIINSGTSIEGLFFSNDKYYLGKEEDRIPDIPINIQYPKK